MADLRAKASVNLPRRFPSAPEQAAMVRRYIGEIFSIRDPRVDDAILLATELFTNAITHCAEQDRKNEVTVAVNVTPACVGVSVTNSGSQSIPCLCGNRHDHGRGLALVSGIAKRWGFTREGDQTCVWFELASPATDNGTSRAPAATTAFDHVEAVDCTPRKNDLTNRAR